MVAFVVMVHRLRSNSVAVKPSANGTDTGVPSDTLTRTTVSATAGSPTAVAMIRQESASP